MTGVINRGAPKAPWHAAVKCQTMESPETRNTAPRETRPNQRVSHSLVALSSAAVLAIYAAGYSRTQSAADRFAVVAAERRPVAPAPAAAPPTPVEPASGTATDSMVASSRLVPAEPPEAASTVTAPVVDIASPRMPVATPAAVPSMVPAPAASTAPATALPAASIEEVRPVATAAIPPVAAVAAATPAPMVPETSVAPPTATAAPATPGPAAAPQYKDGTYLGWGTSRHGDVQAAVVITAGRITEARIAQCFTRWPCSWIVALPPQVVTRQSPNTDYVSGATQSTDAFYYAVVDALAKAK